MVQRKYVLTKQYQFTLEIGSMFVIRELVVDKLTRNSLSMFLHVDLFFRFCYWFFLFNHTKIICV